MRSAFAKAYSMGNTTAFRYKDVHASVRDRELAEIRCHGLGGSLHPVQQSS